MAYPSNTGVLAVIKAPRKADRWVFVIGAGTPITGSAASQVGKSIFTGR